MGAALLPLALLAAGTPTVVARSPLAAGPAVRHAVVLHDAVDPHLAAASLLGPLGLSADTTWSHALRGFSVTAPSALLAPLRHDPRVAVVEQAVAVGIDAQATPSGLVRVDAPRQPAAGIGTGRRVDVDVAVIDTGVDDHPDLVRASHHDCTSRVLRQGCREGGSDEHGHGTHVAGTIAALDDGDDVVGVAPGARIHGYKVLDGLVGRGTSVEVIDALEHVTARGDVEVVNLSLSGSGASGATSRAVAGATQAGLVVVVAAGNGASDAAGYTPANAPHAITVAAITDTDGRPGGAGVACSGPDDALAEYSNWGDVVDLAAPGSCITSLRPDGGTATKSGTSMAAPHVAGAAALYVAHLGIGRSPERWAVVRDGLLRHWTTPQAGPCGYATTRNADPLLHLTRCSSGGGQRAGDGPRTPAPAARPATSRVERISWAEGGYLLGGGRWLDATVRVLDRNGEPLAGAEVRVRVERDGETFETHTGTTNSRGELRLDHDRVPAGTYRAVVTRVTSGGHHWDGHSPDNAHVVED